MSRHEGPRRDSMAYRALALLHEMGGTATRTQLMQCVDVRYRSKSRFTDVIGRPLVVWKFVGITGENVRLLKAGRTYIEACMVPVPVPHVEAAVDVVAPPYRPEVGVLNLAKYFRSGPQRAGASDYRSIPSLMGDVRVPYGSSVAEGDAGEGVHGIA